VLGILNLVKVAEEVLQGRICGSRVMLELQNFSDNTKNINKRLVYPSRPWTLVENNFVDLDLSTK